MHLNPTNTQDNDLHVFEIRLKGEFDLSQEARVKDAFAVVDSAGLVVLNLSKTTFIDSTVLAAIVGLDNATRARGAHLVLTGVAGPVRRLLEVTNLYTFFDVRSASETLYDANQNARRLTLESSIES